MLSEQAESAQGVIESAKSPRQAHKFPVGGFGDKNNVRQAA